MWGHGTEGEEVKEVAVTAGSFCLIPHRALWRPGDRLGWHRDVVADTGSLCLRDIPQSGKLA
jgi:hypothetical protein